MHLDLSWWEHDFAFSNFKIKDEGQIKALRALGLERLRYDPARSDCLPLAASPAPLAAEQKQQLAVVVKTSPALSTALSMREELAGLWARSNASREQLLAQLQDWTARAEQSGIRQLEEFSQRLRRYAV